MDWKLPLKILLTSKMLFLTFCSPVLNPCHRNRFWKYTLSYSGTCPRVPKLPSLRIEKLSCMLTKLRISSEPKDNSTKNSWRKNETLSNSRLGVMKRTTQKPKTTYEGDFGTRVGGDTRRGGRARVVTNCWGAHDRYDRSCWESSNKRSCPCGSHRLPKLLRRHK